jgi:hypothetical protein
VGLHKSDVQRSEHCLQNCAQNNACTHSGDCRPTVGAGNLNYSWCWFHCSCGRGVAQAVSHRLPPRRPWFEPRSGHVGFMVHEMGLGHIFRYFGFPCQFSFHRLLHTHHLSSGSGIVGQLVTDVPSGLILSPPQETKKTKKLQCNLKKIVVLVLFF